MRAAFIHKCTFRFKLYSARFSISLLATLTPRSDARAPRWICIEIIGILAVERRRRGKGRRRKKKQLVLSLVPRSRNTFCGQTASECLHSLFLVPYFLDVRSRDHSSTLERPFFRISLVFFTQDNPKFRMNSSKREKEREFMTNNKYIY